jgi:hypothetical protein
LLDPVEDAFNDIAGSVDAWATFAGMSAQAPFLWERSGNRFSLTDDATTSLRKLDYTVLLFWPAAGYSLIIRLLLFAIS